MESVSLTQLVKIDPSVQTDQNSPYSYLQWKQTVNLVNENDSYSFYTKYVLDWFKANKEKRLSSKFILQQKYLFFLEELKLFFSEEERANWYAKLNFADLNELLLAIPYFAKKLKNISLYYLNLRKKIKQAKLKYNTIGTALCVEKEVYNHIIERFSTENTELLPFLYSIVPEASSLRENLNVHVQELYDDKQYFDLPSDRTKTPSLSGYYNFFHEPTSKFLATQGIVLSSADSIIRSFEIFPSLLEDIVTTDTNAALPQEVSAPSLYVDFIQKYLAETKFRLTITAPTTAERVVEIPLEKGDNYFFYPYGSSDNSTDPNLKLLPRALSSITMEGATAGDSLVNSDRIFIKHGDIVDIAWLRYKQYDVTDKTLKAALKKDSATSFIYPFPGYGVITDQIPWTGVSFETTPEYDFLSKRNKALVNTQYWSYMAPEGDAIGEKYLNETNLVKDGAKPDKQIKFADQIYLRPNKPMDSITTPYGALSGAWLYKFTHTSIPITTELFAQGNSILWPYGLIDATLEYPPQYKSIDFNEVCDPIPISRLDTSFFVAASSINRADVIYKINHYGDNRGESVKLAWLSGATVTTDKVSYVQQDGFNIKLPSRVATRFIWTGPETPLDDVFKTISHKPDCPLSTTTITVSALMWEACECQQVFHTPFGHSGPLYQNNNGAGDFIIKDTYDGIANFHIGTWRDEHGNHLLNSRDFAWYKTKKKKEWGGGKWVSNFLDDPTPFTLKTGEVYFYYRVQDRESFTDMPFYAVTYKFNTNKGKWIEASIDGEGTPYSVDEDSTVVLYPGDFLTVNRQPETQFKKLSAGTEMIQDQLYNMGSVWATYDLIPYICDLNISTFISWPMDDPILGINDNQYPNISFGDITSIYGWTITRDYDGFSQTILNQPTVTFVAPSRGTYSVSVTAILPAGLISVVFTPETSAANIMKYVEQDADKEINLRFFDTEAGPRVEMTYSPDATFGTSKFFVIESNTLIPKITAFDGIIDTYKEFEVNMPTSGFLLEQPLKGWNYSTGRKQYNADGAKPYWATLYFDNDVNTRYKGVYSWGYPNETISGYLPNSAPRVSDIQLSMGVILDYYRKGYAFQWTEPFIYKQFVGQTLWCEVSSLDDRPSELSALYEIKEYSEATALALEIPSKAIVCNVLNGAPVEIYYNALNSFVWSVSVTTEQSMQINELLNYYIPYSPWSNPGNVFYPTVANIPVAEEIYTLDDVGGYFLPQHLGASLFVNKDYSLIDNLSSSNTTGSLLTEDIVSRIGGRGRTKQDQSSKYYTWKDDNFWMKEADTAGALAGAPKKSLTKELQTFIPYQTNNEAFSLGLVTPKSRLTPWGGVNDDVWTDYNNNPKSYTGVVNVSAWAQSQSLKYNEQQVDCWTTDVFGNQYGLIKNLKNVPVSEYSNTAGELWVRTNVGVTMPSQKALSATLIGLKGNDSGLYNELIGQGVYSIKNYFNTLFIETSSAVTFVNLEYLYSAELLDSYLDNIQSIYNTQSFTFDNTWFFAKEKKVITLFTQTSSNFFSPVLYQTDVNVFRTNQIFPNNVFSVYANLSSPNLSSIDVSTLSRGLITYNSLKETFLVTYNGKDVNGQLFIVDFHIKNFDNPVLQKINIYTDTSNQNSITEPPIVNITGLSALHIPAGDFNVNVDIDNNPTSVVLLNYDTSLTAVTAAGGVTFAGNLSAGLYHINYVVSNSIGDSTYCLTLSAL